MRRDHFGPRIGALAVLAGSAWILLVTATAPSAAAASTLTCASEAGQDLTLISGSAGCRAAVDDSGHARALSYDGIGYARAGSGGSAVGVGTGGGIGASHGSSGLALAFALGPDAYAFTDRGTDTGGGTTVSVAFAGSRAQEVPAGHRAVCLGTAAVVWDFATGYGCLATPLGLWCPAPTSELGTGAVPDTTPADFWATTEPRAADSGTVAP
ncbi:DUF6764 family protein [Nocardia stercoris]|uniref:Protein kinase n=1 Tax=Nocardia stercoris TaxID=2483361 RepID=A0A3M2L915_9NOCA|nr:DUF6764 family protein [Nocardia stercoris]RMI34069.1 hypothetical protein EBN03_06425 [Nocardia stercoris]